MVDCRLALPAAASSVLQKGRELQGWLQARFQREYCLEGCEVSNSLYILYPVVSYMHDFNFVITVSRVAAVCSCYATWDLWQHQPCVHVAVCHHSLSAFVMWQFAISAGVTKQAIEAPLWLVWAVGAVAVRVRAAEKKLR